MTVAVNAVLTLILIGVFKFMGWQEEHMALALASSGSALVNAGLLYFYLHKRDIFRFGTHWKKLMLQFLIANSLMVLALAYALTWYNGDVAEWLRVAQVLGLCMVGAVTYAVGLILTGIRPRHLRP